MRSRLRPVLRLAALVVVLVAGLSGSARAATFAVTNLGDATPAGACDGDCTLREAVIAANAAAGDDAIVLPAGTITLAEATTNTATPATGDLDLTPGSRITVTGAGAGATVVDGGDKDRIFEVQGGGAALTLRDLTLRNGRGDGSGVRVSAAGGGASSLDAARTTFSGHVDDSTAVAVEQSGTAAIADATFADNGAPVALPAASPSGAAISAQQTATLSVTRTTFSRNRASANGGAVAVSNDAKASISASVFEGGETGSYGGALFVQNAAQVTVSGSRFTGNVAKDGGGAVIVWNQSRLDITGSTFAGNSAGNGLGGGGAIGIWNQVTVTVADTTISGNTITSTTGLGGGGGIGVINQAKLTVERTTIDGNRVLAGPPDTGTLRGGGALYLLNQADVTLVNTTVSGNTSALPGGAALLLNQARLRLVNATVAGNASDQGGGAFFNRENDAAEPGRLALANTILAGNLAAGVPNACANDPLAPTTILQTEGHNLESTDTCAFLTGAGDRRSTDAGLAALADNGGPVRTMAIASTSAAFNAADPALCPATDARGLARPQLGGCDIGAFELQPVPPAAPPAPAPAAAAAKPKALTAAQLIAFASNRTCISRRALAIRLKRPDGVTLVSATVFVNGKRVTVVKGKRLRAPVNLKGLPKGRYTVKITVVTAAGQKITGTRKYRTCAKKVKRRSRSRV